LQMPFHPDGHRHKRKAIATRPEWMLRMGHTIFWRILLVALLAVLTLTPVLLRDDVVRSSLEASLVNSLMNGAEPRQQLSPAIRENANVGHT
jgi:hypothetical protein